VKEKEKIKKLKKQKRKIRRKYQQKVRVNQLNLRTLIKINSISMFYMLIV